MEQTILVMEVIQEVCEADNGEPDCGLDNYFKKILINLTFLGENFHRIEGEYGEAAPPNQGKES